MALTYSTAFGIVSDVFGKVHKATGLHIKYDDETTDGHLCTSRQALVRSLVNLNLRGAASVTVCWTLSVAIDKIAVTAYDI